MRGGTRGVPRDSVLRRETQGAGALSGLILYLALILSEPLIVFCAQVAVGKTGGLEYPRSKWLRSHLTQVNAAQNLLFHHISRAIDVHAFL